jgi:hypothetical protein
MGVQRVPTVLRALLAGAFLGCNAIHPALGADIEFDEAAGGWRVSVAPYLWAAGMSGDVGLFGRDPVDLDLKFSDILDDLKFAAMGVAEAHNGTIGVFGDVMYVHIEAEEGISRSVQNVPVALEATVDTENVAATLMGEYRVIGADDMTLDLMAGARLWHVDNDISARLRAGGAELAQFSGDDGATWVDPMIGFKARINTGSPFYLTGWGMIGGAGIGSDLAWDAMGAVGYQWTSDFATVAGYRALGVDYGNDGFVFDVVEQGAFIGGIFTF